MSRVMPRRGSLHSALTLFVLFMGAAGLLTAVVVPEKIGVREKTFRHPDLDISLGLRTAGELPPQAALQAAADLAALGVPADRGRIDVRGGRWSSITPSQPLVPGRGVANELAWDQGPPAGAAEFGQRAAAALRSYLHANATQLRVDTGQLAQPGSVSVQRGGDLVQFHLARVVDGVPVRDSYVKASMVMGNLVLFGAHNWGDVDVSTAPSIASADALAAVQTHVEPYSVAGAWGKTELILVPTARGRNPNQVQLGQGYGHRLAWVVRPSFAEDGVARYEGLVDAHSGELISFEDTAQYATTREVVGGVLPEHNDPSQGPQGTEQAGWPMPFVNVDNAAGTFTGDAGGNIPQCLDGSISTQLVGPYMLMNDNCGAINESTTGDVLDLGTSPGTDCNVAAGASPGNTRASRSGFYEMNRIKEIGRSQLPNNSWLKDQLQANMNINQNCNATWNGQVNFYTSGGGCSNTGEIAGVFDHEWGHGMDANDATPGISNPGEGIPDVYAALRLGTSCIGFNFRPGVPCGGYGDPCVAVGSEPACSGVRDIDYAKRASGLPHTFSWVNSNPSCGSSHCRGAVYSEAVWSLWKRDLPAVYGMDNNTALEVATRLTFIGAGGVGTWFSGSPPFGGCAATSGYKQFLVADDDNGNLNDGTPHMQAIFDAFNRQEIACNDLTAQDSGCSGTPTTAPSVTATATDRGAQLSWGAVAGATEYEIYRTDGVFACDFGKVKVGSTTGTSFTDSGMQNGREYYYVVIPKGPSDTCFGPASSCTTVTPVAGGNLQVDAASAAVALSGGDGDDFVDNCEDGTVTFDVINIGNAAQDNLRIVDIRPSNSGVTINTALPAPISANLGICATAQGSFDFTAAGLAFGETLEFEVDVTSDQLAGVRTGILVFANAETDLDSVASRTYDFESGDEGWTLIQGTFFRASTDGGAGGSTWYERTSSNLDNQCDQLRSPAIRLTATSTIEVFTNFDIENQSSPGTWWDRANVAFFENGSRNAVNPDSGRPYNATGAGATCVTAGQSGWAASQPTWASSGFSAAALDSAGRAGQTVQIDIAYGTDVSVVGDGFRFDRLTVTDFEELVADGQSDTCTPECAVDADCDDGLFCNGAETCSAGSCQSGSDPCPGESCNETTDTCEPLVCDNDGVCEAGEDCSNCPNDCPSFPIGGAQDGNGVCEAGDGETCYTTSDCNGKTNGKPAGRFCCGLDVNESTPYGPDGCGAECDAGGNTCTTTPVGGGGSTCCGDSVCEGPEDGFNCEIDCGPPPVCGNDVTETGEVCDGSDLGGATCGDFGCTGGTLACQSDCSDYDTSGCTGCCVPTHSKEKGPRCSDGLDNDCDGLTDEADPDC